jgi:hypothetical protein
MCAPVGLEDRAMSSSLKAMTESCSTDNCRFASAHLFSGSKLFRIIAQRKPCMYNVRQSLNQLLVGLAFLILIATRTRRSLSFLRCLCPSSGSVKFHTSPTWPLLWHLSSPIRLLRPKHSFHFFNYGTRCIRPPPRRPGPRPRHGSCARHSGPGSKQLALVSDGNPSTQVDHRIFFACPARYYEIAETACRPLGGSGHCTGRDCVAAVSLFLGVGPASG